MLPAKATAGQKKKNVRSKYFAMGIFPRFTAVRPFLSGESHGALTTYLWTAFGTCCWAWERQKEIDLSLGEFQARSVSQAPGAQEPQGGLGFQGWCFLVWCASECGLKMRGCSWETCYIVAYCGLYSG